MLETVLKVQHLFKSYGTIKAVNDLSFTVNKGEIYGLLGPNGSGKSTTIRILLSLIHKDAGEVSLFNRKLQPDTHSIRSKIGVLIESPDFYGYLSAYDNLRLLSAVSGKKISKKTILEKIGLVGLKDFAGRKVRIFSHGMKQRLGIAQALINDPEMIILDEPANGLDPHGIIDVRKLIINFSRDMGITIILSSHILKEVEMIADRMVVMHHGKAIVEGNVKELVSGKGRQIKLSVSDIDMAIRILKKGGIENIIVNPYKELIVKSSDFDAAGINRMLIMNGVDVKEINPAQTLEDLYMQVTEYALESR